MKLVKFKDGRFGIRKWLFGGGYLFFDFETNHLWLTHDSYYFEQDCKRDELTARNKIVAFKKRPVKQKPVKQKPDYGTVVR